MTIDNRNKTDRKMVQLRYVLIPIALIFSALIILIIVSAIAPKPAKKPVVIKAPLVEVVRVNREDITFQVRSQGSVNPRTETQLISEVSGMIVDVSDKFNVGGYFKKGEQILAIDDITYQVALVQAQSRLGSAKANLVEEQARAKQAEEEWLLSGKTVGQAPVLALRIPQQQRAEADLLAAEADLKAAQVKLERTKIIAPYDAMIKSKLVDIGQYVSTGTQLAMTFAVDYAEVRLPIKQKDVEFLNLPRIEQVETKTSLVELYYQLSGNKASWHSKITRYEGVVDSASRVHYIVAQLDDPYAILSESAHKQIHIGTFVNAIIKGKVLENIVAIPRSAVQGGNTLYTTDLQNKLHIQEIDVLRSDAEYVYTMDEFLAGHRIILTKLEAPIKGMKLRVDGEKSEEKPDEETLTAVSEIQEKG